MWKTIIALSLIVSVSIAWPPTGRWRKYQRRLTLPINARPSSLSNEVPDSLEDLLPWTKDVVCDKCPPGYGLVTMCNATHRTVCQPCTLSVTFSDREPHYKPCTPCSKCGPSMYEDIACTTTSDTFCDSCTSLRGFVNDDFILKCSTSDEPRNAAVNDFDSKIQDFLKIMDHNDLQKSPWDLDEDDSNEDDLDVNVFKLNSDLAKESKEISAEETTSEEELKQLDQQVADLLVNVDRELDEEEKLERVPSNLTEYEKKVEENVKDINTDSDEESDEESKERYEKPIWSLRPIEPVNPEESKRDFSEEDFDFDDTKKLRDPEMKKNIVFKPSEHSYPYEELVHPDQLRFKQVKKLIWLYGITAVMLVTALMFVTCYAGSYYRRRRAMFARIPYNMTLEDSRIIREAAERLEQSEKQQMEKRRNPFSIHENPLEEYLDDEPVYRSTESLIPTVHKNKKIQLV